MMQLRRYMFLLGWAIAAALAFCPLSASANGNTSPVINATADPSQTNGQTCITDTEFADQNEGASVIGVIFSTINTILSHVATDFYTNIVGSTEYRNALNAAVMLYLVVYGVLIMFNIANARSYDVMIRLIKIGAVYGVMGGVSGTDGFAFFYQWVGGPFIYGMNELLSLFISIAGFSSASPVHVFTSSPSATYPLDPAAMSVLFSPMTAVISSTYFTAMVTEFFENGPSLLVGAIMGWALVNFIYLLVGAVATYLKSVVGLSFLFGVAPIFFVFLLFEKSRQVFQGWLNQVVSFALQPVMLFAFLSFYIVLINTALSHILPSGANYCYTRIATLPGASFTLYGWRPVLSGSVGAGDYLDTTGHLKPGDINMIDACYFFILCHLGYSFSKYIGEIAQAMSSGMGPGYLSPESVQGKFKQALSMGRVGPSPS